MPSSQRRLIAISGIPGSGKTTFARIIVKRINQINAKESPGCGSGSIAVVVPLDGFHFSRAQLSAMPDPINAHARRGAPFTFDDEEFLMLVKKLRKELRSDSPSLYAPSFDHAVKDPVKDGIVIPATARVVVFEGNYLSLNKGLWKESAALMDELWFLEVEFGIAKQRLLRRHVKAGIAKNEMDAIKRVTENDLLNGSEIIEHRLDVHEMVISKDDESWKEDE